MSKLPIRNKVTEPSGLIKRRFDGARVTLNKIWIYNTFPKKEEKISPTPPVCIHFEGDINSYIIPEFNG